MSKSVLSAKHFHDEEAAYAYLESKIWPEGPICPHCGGFNRISKMQGKATRIGLYKCYQCRKQFRVTVGTVFKSSHVPLNIWLQAVALLTSSKKGISSNQLHRTLGVTLKTAWFMSHRIREAFRDGSLGPLGGNGVNGIVQADETFIGREPGKPKQRGIVRTNTVEGYFSMFKRGLKGTYQHCAKKHLHRYFAEFDFRYDNRVRLGVGDIERSENAFRDIVGKRLTYRTTHSGA